MIYRFGFYLGDRYFLMISAWEASIESSITIVDCCY